MRKVILTDTRPIAPFNERARDLRILNKPLWLWQRDLLTRYCQEEREVAGLSQIPDDPVETLVYRDNLFFDQAFLDAFIGEARRMRKPVRVAFRTSDPAISAHALPLNGGFVKQDQLLLGDLWYYPFGVQPNPRPLVIDLQAREIGYYHVPTYMASEKGDLVYQVPLRAFLPIEHWIHLFVANNVFGLFAEGARTELAIQSFGRKLRILATALLEQRQLLACSALVRTGRNVHIDPTAIIQGPTVIGDNVTIGAGAVIDVCHIGSNVTVSQGCHLMLSVVSDGCFLPFRSALFMTSLMENSMVAQNTCLQLCVIGRNSFVGAGTTFTDFNLLPTPLKAVYEGRLVPTGMPVLGGCVGHNCRLGSGLVIYPARMIESDVVLLASGERRVITENVSYEQSDHHKTRFAHLHPRLYPRADELAGEQDRFLTRMRERERQRQEQREQLRPEVYPQAEEGRPGEGLGARGLGDQGLADQALTEQALAEQPHEHERLSGAS